MNDYRKEVEEARERWADDPIEINAAREQRAYVEGFNAGIKVMTRVLINCKNCKYYDDIEDHQMPGYRECHYFSNWAMAHYMLETDYCSCAKLKEPDDE